MTAPIRFQDAPQGYDVRDQVELRRSVARAVDQLRQAISSVVVVSSPSTGLVIDGGTATMDFGTPEILDGGSA
jgi:hypothetical protein